MRSPSPRALALSRAGLAGLALASFALLSPPGVAQDRAYQPKPSDDNTYSAKPGDTDTNTETPSDDDAYVAPLGDNAVDAAQPDAAKRGRSTDGVYEGSDDGYAPSNGAVIAPAPSNLPPNPDLASPDPDRRLRAQWEQKAQLARARVTAAQLRVERAEAAYTSMMTRNYPRGDAKEEILVERSKAQAELAAAQGELANLPDEARAADVPPAWLEP